MSITKYIEKILESSADITIDRLSELLIEREKSGYVVPQGTKVEELNVLTMLMEGCMHVASSTRDGTDYITSTQSALMPVLASIKGINSFAQATAIALRLDDVVDNETLKKTTIENPKSSILASLQTILEDGVDVPQEDIDMVNGNVKEFDARDKDTHGIIESILEDMPEELKAYIREKYNK